MEYSGKCATEELVLDYEKAVANNTSLVFRLKKSLIKGSLLVMII